MIILQNEKSGRILKLRDGFDISTLILSFIELGFLPSLFRGEFFTAFKLFVIQNLFWVFVYPTIEGSKISHLLLLICINVWLFYTIYRCVVNNKKRIENLRKKGYYPVKFNNII
ncbi:hypothetical protein [Clostridium thermobutyricum]|uniref:hypothetical protein n=1 Tax=Clostridium thermobutyricum TaxID=29372 RepID=UPI002942B700|nr:hypothetical protein [Clostridium thermobutyricum]